MEPIYRHTTELASGIPLGGLGTGSVEIRADGRFHDWEIFNNYLWSGNCEEAAPEMWSEDAFFAIRAKPEGEPARIRLLYDDDKRSKATSGWYDYAAIYNYPFLRNVAAIEYSSRHPFAHLKYEDPAIPLEVRLKAFTPFIPFNAKDSGLPLAYFVFDVRNTGSKPCEASLMFSLRNCVGYDLDKLTLKHEVRREAGATTVVMAGSEMDPERRTSGTMAISALSADATVMSAWTDGRGLTGFDNPAAPGMSQLFYAFRDRGVLDGTDEPWTRAIAQRKLQTGPTVLHGDRQSGFKWRAAMCQKVTLRPGESRQIVFSMAWHFPNHYHYATGRRLGHAYENHFADAAEVAAYGNANRASLQSASEPFVEEFYRGMEPWLAASFNAQLTTFPQAFWWTKDGELAAWEGSACCQIIPNIHTIWSSWQPLLFFPELYLQNKRRAIRFVNDVEEPGGCCRPFIESEHAHREGGDQSQKKDLGGWFDKRWKLQGYTVEDFRPGTAARAARGRFLFVSSPLELLRDMQWTGDTELLEELWPLVRTRLIGGIEADTNGDGLPDGEISFLTYDHWFPPATNCYRGTMWLAELRAGVELARRMKDNEAEKRLAEALKKGISSFEKLFFNGKYYNFAYSYRTGKKDTGCLADQVSGNLFLRLCGLEPVHRSERAQSALRAVFEHNRKHEEGLLNGADPEGRTDWGYFARFSERGDDEALSGQWVTPWTGTEYFVAATMIAEGLVEEGLTVARDVYERCVCQGMLYNHMECGEHYFRALAAWAMLPALQGLRYDATVGHLYYAPQKGAEDTVLLLPGVWGRIAQDVSGSRRRVRVRVMEGQIRVASVELATRQKAREGRVSVDGSVRPAAFDTESCTVRLVEPVVLVGGMEMVVEVE